MDLPTALRRLHELGKEPIRKTYLRHGASEPVHGVTYADLGKLAKEIGTDHALALELWRTGVHDARLLAALVCDPARFDPALCEEWLSAVTGRGLLLTVAAPLGRSPAGRTSAERWIESNAEWELATGWCVLAAQALDEAVPDQALSRLLPLIERRIHRAPNYARYAMNQCLIGIGARPSLRTAALDAARRVGPVEVNHGDTECETPVAFDYIQKIAARGAAKSARSAAKGGAKAKGKAKGKAKATAKAGKGKAAAKALTPAARAAGKRPAKKTTAKPKKAKAKAHAAAKGARFSKKR